jgi:hypothetical protein
MRKILSQKQRDKRQQRNILIMGIVLILIMALSMLGESFTSRTDQNQNTNLKKTYNGIEFTNNNQYWIFNVNNIEYLAFDTPDDLKNFSVNINKTLKDYTGNLLYFAGETNEAFAILGTNLGKVSQRIQESVCVDAINVTCKENDPVKNCSVDNVIIIRESLNKEKVYQMENCIIIDSSAENMTKYAQAVFYKILNL